MGMANGHIYNGADDNASGVAGLLGVARAFVRGKARPKRSVLFIKETVGLPMPDGSRHDGYWYASDVGGAIHKGRIDLFTGNGSSSMSPLMGLNLATLTVMKAGVFHGCPPGEAR